jgi:hypothetical protein
VIQDPSVHTFQFNVLACEGYNADGEDLKLSILKSKSATGSCLGGCHPSSGGKQCKDSPNNEFGFNSLVARLHKCSLSSDETYAARLPNCGKLLMTCATKRM